MSDEFAGLERAVETLKVTQRAIAAKDARLDKNRQRYQVLVTYTEIEASRRKSAEARANKLRAQVERLQGQLDSEIAALERSESARRAAESATRSYRNLSLKATAAWQCTQRIVESKENEIATTEGRQGGFRPLQDRLDDARKGKEMDKELSIVIKLAMEGLVAKERGDSLCVSSFEVPTESVECVQRRGDIEPGPMSQALSIEDGRISALKASVMRRSFKAQRILAQIHEFRLQEKNNTWHDDGA